MFECSEGRSCFNSGNNGEQFKRQLAYKDSAGPGLFLNVIFDGRLMDHKKNRVYSIRSSLRFLRDGVLGLCRSPADYEMM
jgi:hypothetical protein